MRTDCLLSAKSGHSSSDLYIWKGSVSVFFGTSLMTLSLILSLGVDLVSNGWLVKKKTSAKQRVLDTAERLFYQHGISSVGVDRIAAEAGVGKMTLYRHFPSKDDLIVAYLQKRDIYWRDAFESALASSGLPGRDGIERLFDRLAEWFASDTFYGCAFINAESERVGGRAATLARSHKDMMRVLIDEQLAAIDADDRDVLTEQILMLTEGAIVTASISHDARTAERAKAAALTLIDAAHPTPVA